MKLEKPCFDKAALQLGCYDYVVTVWAVWNKDNRSTDVVVMLT